MQYYYLPQISKMLVVGRVHIINSELIIQYELRDKKKKGKTNILHNNTKGHKDKSENEDYTSVILYYSNNNLIIIVTYSLYGATALQEL